jgi:transglutaminase-like putative cysteine protease
MKWIVLLLISLAASLRAATVEEITALVGDGHWQQARQEIAGELAQTNLDFQTRQDLLFQRDRIQRMRLDFDKTREQVFHDARAVVPSITEEQFSAWEKSGAVEFMDIDGTRWYYHKAGANLFRVNPDARALKIKAHVPSEDSYRLRDVRNVISTFDKTGEPRNSPKTWRVTYSLNVKPGEVPPGEIIRAWLPFPHAGNRQKNIRLISADPPQFVQSDTNAAISSLYFEKPAASNGPTPFKIIFEYTADAFFQPLDPARVQPVPTNDPALAPFLGAEPPQIVFSDEIKNLSAEIVGAETNSYLKAQKIFAWVYEHIPWTTAREYSTIECLPRYALGCGHGDCGIKTMTFMTLCRFNGIPARWETGWTTDPVLDMHDWCEIYLAPYGWVPADATYGVADSADEREKWFYLGGIDAGRLVVNTDYNQPLYPAKTFFRSEIVDFQRGEAEWRGGNLYFNQWTWDYNAEEIKPDQNTN